MVFKKIAKAFTSPIKKVKNLIKAPVKMAEAGFKLASILLQILQSLAGVISQVLTGIVFVFKTINDHGLAEGIAVLVRLLLGVVLSVVVIVLGPLLRVLLAAVFLYIRPALQTLLYVLILVVLVPIKLAIALLDCLLQGRLRFLEYDHESPDAWWQRAGYERGNRYRRFVLTWLPCRKGYVPNAGGYMCACESSGYPSYSPAALLMRLYVWGSFREWGRRLPERSAEAIRRFRAMCLREYPSVLLDNKFGRYATDMVECLVLSRNALFPASRELDDIATYASWVTRAAGGRATTVDSEDITFDSETSPAGSYTIPKLPTLLFASFVVALSISAMRRARMLTYSSF